MSRTALSRSLPSAIGYSLAITIGMSVVAATTARARPRAASGGGIIAVSPGKFGIAVVSPPLDDAGNSIRAHKAIADISTALGGNPYVGR